MTRVPWRWRTTTNDFAKAPRGTHGVLPICWRRHGVYFSSRGFIRKRQHRLLALIRQVHTCMERKSNFSEQARTELPKVNALPISCVTSPVSYCVALNKEGIIRYGILLRLGGPRLV